MKEMQPHGFPSAPKAIEPRIGGMTRSVAEEEEVQLALEILRLNQRLRLKTKR